MVVPAVNGLGDAGKINDMSGGLKSFDDLPGSTISPSLNDAAMTAASAAQISVPEPEPEVAPHIDLEATLRLQKEKQD